MRLLSETLAYKRNQFGIILLNIIRYGIIYMELLISTGSILDSNR